MRTPAAVLALSLALAACSSSSDTMSTFSSLPEAALPADSSWSCQEAAGSQLSCPRAGDIVAVLSTSRGDISLRLFPEAAPLAVENFATLAGNGYYDGIIFHRVIKGFMIQGGDPTGTGMGGESAFGPTFVDEIAPGYSYLPGTLAMANRGPNTNGSQFFIMQGNTPLPPLYTIFGQVFAGQQVVDAIGNTPTDISDKPLEAQTITGVRVFRVAADSAAQ